MPDPFVVNHIRRLPVFQNLPEKQLELLSDIVEVLSFEQGGLVFQQGAPAQGLFLLVSGRGLLTQFVPNPTNPSGGMIEQPVGELRPGQFMGMKALFEPDTERASLRIVEPAIVLFLKQDSLRQLLTRQPELRSNLGLGPKPKKQPTGEASQPLFAGQRGDEIVVQLYRRHWWSFARFAWIPLLIAIGFFAGAAYLASTSPLLAVGAVVLGLVIPAGLFYFMYVEWQDDAIILSDQRVVRVSTTLLKLDNSISEVPLESILEVSTSQPPADVFARIFKYSNIEIKTAGSHGNIPMSMLPQAKQLRDLIFAHRDRAKQKEAAEHKAAVRSEIAKILQSPADASAASSAQPLSQPPPETKAPRPPLSPMVSKFTDKDGKTVYRKHYTDWLRTVTFPGLIILASVTAFVVLLLLPDLEGTVRLIGLISAFFFLLIGGVLFYFGDWDWRYDVFVIADDSITIVKKRPFWIQNQVDQIKLSQVDNVVSNTRGLFDNVLNRGSVTILLIGSDDGKELTPIHKPQEMQAEISRRQSQFREKQRLQAVQGQRAALSELLTEYHRENTPNAPVDASRADAFTYTHDTPAREVPPPQNTPAPPDPPAPPIQDGARPPRVPRIRRD
jgi:membrane protein YdbS with pleckstrin-like domain